MRVELALLEIDRRRSKVLSTQIIGVENESEWIIRQYSRNESGLLYPGFRLVDSLGYSPAELKLFIGHTGREIHLHYDEKTGYFFEPPQEKESGELQDDISVKPTGISNAGAFFIEICDIDKKLIYQTKSVTVLPSIITQDMYKKMIKDLLSLHQDLVLHEEAKIFVDGKAKDSATRMFYLLEKIEHPLYQINKEPNVKLETGWTQLPYHRIRKMTPKLMMERQLYPNREKYVTENIKESHYTYENKKIFEELKKMDNLAEASIKLYENKVQNMKNEKEMVRARIKYLEQKFNKTPEEKRLLSHLKPREKKTQELFDRMEATLSQWKINKEFINKLMLLPLFKSMPLEYNIWKPTQVFIHHPFYSIVFKELHDFSQHFQLTDQENVPLALENITQIFEVWTYFEMIKLLKFEHKWEIHEENQLSSMVNQHLKKNYGKLDGFKVKLTRTFQFRSPIHLTLVFNKSLPLKHLVEKGKHPLRPDYTFIFEGSFGSKTFYLDAKYQNYREHPHQWGKNMRDIWRKYYVEAQKDNRFKAEAAFVVHCVEEETYVDYGGEGWLYRIIDGRKEKSHTIQHRLGSFYLTPYQSRPFLTWMSMIMEWYLKYYNICWNCGESDHEKINDPDRQTESGYRKHLYTCKSCDDVWVKTHCFNKNCLCDPLIKHSLPEQQYHVETEDDWMVKCPRCHRSKKKKASFNGLN